MLLHDLHPGLDLGEDQEHDDHETIDPSDLGNPFPSIK